MATGFEIFTKLIPDTTKLDKLEKEGIKLKADISEKSPLRFKPENAPIPQTPPIVEEKKEKGGFGGLKNTLTGVLGGLAIFSILKKMLGFLISLEPIKAVLEVIGAIMKLFFLPFAVMIMKVLSSLFIPLLKLMPLWLEFWSNPIENLKKAFKKAYTFELKIGDFKLKFKPIFDKLWWLIWTNLVGLTSLGKVIWGWLVNIILPNLGVLANFGSWLWDKIITGIGNITPILRGFGEWLWKHIVTPILEGISILAKIGEWLWNTLISIFTFENLKKFGKWLWDSITLSITNGIIALAAIGKWIWNKLTTTFTFSNLKAFGSWLFKMITTALLTNLKILASFGKWLYSKITGGIGDLAKALSKFGSWLWNKIAKAIGNIKEAIGSFGSWLWNKITSAIGNLGDTLGSFGSWLWNKITSAFSFSKKNEEGGKTSVWQIAWKILTGTDFIVTKRGDIIKTHPEDYIFATKNPAQLGAATTQNKEVHIHLTIPGILDDLTIRKIANVIRMEVERAI